MDRVPTWDRAPSRVLCVDDDRDVADSLAALLRVAGFQALACYDGHGALVAADGFRPDVCLVDLGMPGMHGDELALKLRRHPGRRPVLVAVTGRTDEASRARTRAAGFHLHLVKPVDPRRLLALVKKLSRRGGLLAPGGPGDRPRDQRRREEHEETSGAPEVPGAVDHHEHQPASEPGGHEAWPGADDDQEPGHDQVGPGVGQSAEGQQ
jgi:DNA-binding response OmpR family regulator